jgi:hypothetical protein
VENVERVGEPPPFRHGGGEEGSLSDFGDDFDSLIWHSGNHPAIHYQDMLSDSLRMRRYREAIEAVVRPGDVVADLGTGLGVLALMAVRAGASLVYAIDQKPASLWLAEKIIRANGAADRVELLRADVRTLELEQPVDVIVNELIGNFGTDEGIYESVEAFARRNLASHGRILPERLRTFIVPVEYGDDFHGVFRPDVEGVDLSAALTLPYQPRAILRTLRETPKALAKPALVEAVEFINEMPPRPGTKVELEFEIERAGRLQGFVGCFDAVLAPGYEIKTWPTYVGCHWQHWHWPVQPPLNVSPGQRLVGSLSMQIEPSGATGWELDWRRDVN